MGNKKFLEKWKKEVLERRKKYRKEALRQRQRDRADTKRAIKLLKKEYVEDLKDFKSGKYNNVTLAELRKEYLRELRQLQKRYKNPYPDLKDVP